MKKARTSRTLQLDAPPPQCAPPPSPPPPCAHAPPRSYHSRPQHGGLAAAAAAPRVFEVEGGLQVWNGNPRSEQLLGRAAAREGFATDRGAAKFLHRLRLHLHGRNTRAVVDTPAGEKVVTAATHEWALEQHLYSGCDKAAAHNVGVVMATRLGEAGIGAVFWDIEGRRYHGRVKAFIDAVRANGIRLRE